MSAGAASPRAGAVAAVLVALAPAARADAPVAAPPVRSVLLEASMAFRRGAAERTLTFQTFMGFTGGLPLPRWRCGAPFAALGARAEVGSVSSEHEVLVDDQRVPAVGGRTVLGPELRLGLAWPSAPIATYAYLGVAALWIDTDAEPTSRPWIPERGHRRGMRASLGAAAPGFYHPLVELSWEHVAGTDRLGLALGFAL